MKKRLAAFAGTVRRFVRLRPLAVTMAMMLIHIASKETTIDGTIDRLIQFAFAYALVAWAMVGTCVARTQDPTTTGCIRQS